MSSRRTEPSDIHVAVGDLERANGELHRPVDSKLVLLECVGELPAAAAWLVEPAWRNLVIQIAGSNRQKLCRPNRDVDLCDRRVHFAVVEAVEVQSDALSERSDSRLSKAAGHEDRATSIGCIRCAGSRRLDFLGSTRRAQRNQTRPPEHLAPDAAQICESFAYRLQEHRASRSEPPCEVRTSRVGRWQRRCRRAFVGNTREYACLFVIAARTNVCFRTVRLKTRGESQAASCSVIEGFRSRAQASPLPCTHHGEGRWR